MKVLRWTGLAVLVCAGAAAHAQSQSVNLILEGQAPDVLKLSTTLTSNYGTGPLNYRQEAGASFIAYCIEPEQSNALLGASKTYSSSSFTGAQAKLLQSLFSSSYAEVDNAPKQAAFQLAIWELMRESAPSMSLGGGTFVLKDNPVITFNNVTYDLVQLANGYIQAAQAYTGPDLFVLTKYSSALYQDLIQAAPVPEAGSLAMMLGGLGMVALMARRRRVQ